MFLCNYKQVCCLVYRVTDQRLKCANISYVAHLLHQWLVKGVVSGWETIEMATKFVVAWALVLTQDMLCWHSYDVQPEGCRPEGLHHNCANISCVSARAHATTNTYMHAYS